jgi:23S rRNA (guanine2445-N2)-methyltransferase / 23S rRNA (guanine2069-N7)-methyltransferase
MSTLHRLIVTCPLYCEDLIEKELIALGLTELKIHHGAVKAEGTLEQAYRICLGSRIANKVLFPLLEFEAEDKDELIAKVSAFPFIDHFSLNETFAVESQISHTIFPNPNYATLVTKDAVVDSFRRRLGKRPDVDPRRPDIRLDLFMEGRKGSISIELEAQGLFKREYRRQAGEAPLKENVAAAILLRAGWDEIASGGGALVDLMCGSGTFLFEALLIAGNIAPGALRKAAGPEKWKAHDRALWQKLTAEAAEQKRNALAGKLPVILGYDIDGGAVANATANLKEAGLLKLIHVRQSDFRSLKAPGATLPAGLVVANPPYGKRLGDGTNLPALYGQLGQVLSRDYEHWRAAVLAGDKDLARAVGLRAEKIHTLYNGPIRCTLAHFALSQANRYRPPRR